MQEPTKKPESNFAKDHLKPELTYDTDATQESAQDLDQLEIKLKILKSYLRKDFVSTNDSISKKSDNENPKTE